MFITKKYISSELTITYLRKQFLKTLIFLGIIVIQIIEEHEFVLITARENRKFIDKEIS